MSDDEANSQHSQSESSGEESPDITFMVQLTRYKSVAKVAKNGKSTMKLEKDMVQKAMEHTLQDTRTGYLSFLRCILDHHNVKEYPLNNEANAFKFKYYAKGIPYVCFLLSF